MRVYKDHSVVNPIGINKYRATFYYTEFGNNKRTQWTFNAISYEDALELANDHLAKLKATTTLSCVLGDSNALLSAYMTCYVDHLINSKLIDITTANNYLCCVKQIMRHMPYNITIKAVRPRNVSDMVEGHSRDGLCNETIKKSFRFLKQVMSFALDEECINSLPFNRSTKAPKTTFQEPNALDSNACAILLEALDAMGDTPVSLAIRIALATGM